MAARWERYLERWVRGGLIDPATAARVRAYETVQEKALRLRWPVLLAIGFGGLLLGAGVLLFVAAHWDELSPGARFGVVLALVALFHLGAALVTERFPALATMLHAVGTVCLGAGIFLTGQIFNLQEHWPGGVLLWALGAWVAWALLRDWPQAALVALLTPWWLGGEWVEATKGSALGAEILIEGLLLLSLSYLTALLPGRETSARRALMWIGGLMLIPLAAAVPLVHPDLPEHELPLPEGYRALGWIGALALPLALAWWLRRGAAWMNAAAAAWVILLGTMGVPTGGPAGGTDALLRRVWHELGPYAMWAMGSLGLIAWGLHEARRERINLGIAGFAMTVLAFYFAEVMDRLGRAASLIGLGVLFVVGGWLLERGRRRLVVRLER